MHVGGEAGDEQETRLGEYELNARSHLAAIIDSSDDAIVSKDLSGIIQSWNRGAERIFGYTADEVIGKPVLMLLPEERKNEEEMIFARIRKGESVDHFETQRVTKSGRLVNVSISISPIRNSRGEIVGASKIARDIDERVAAETLSSKLAAIIDSSDDAIVSKDLNGIVQSWNGGAERLFGYMAEEMIGQPILKLLPQDRKDEEHRILARLRRGERVDHFESVRRHKDGRLIDVSITISPIRDAKGKIVGASKVARDISDRKILETTMSRLKEELEERVSERTAALEMAHKEMESFTYSVAHDLRGPLREIALTGALLYKDYSSALPTEGLDLVHQQIDAAKRLARLIEDLLRYARLGQAALTVSDVDLSSLAKDIAGEQNNAHPECAIQVQDGLFVKGDANLLRLLLQNLLENACKFSPNGGVVRVGMKDKVFFVEDQGIGFDMAYADKIFRPFERLVRNAEVVGTGIGLANVHRIIQKHNGAIWVNSNVGKGTIFYFTIPDPL